MKNQTFGVEIELTGITRKKALPCESYFNCVLDGYIDCGIDTEQLFNAMLDAKKL